MSKTVLTDVENHIQKYWAPQWMKELRENLLLGTLVNKEYDGEIKKGGDEVTVSQVNAPEGQLLTIGTDADAFSTEKVSTSYVKVKADKRAVAAYEFEDVVDLQSKIQGDDPEVREALMFAVRKQINTYLYSLVNPSTSSPDHLIASVTDFNASQLGACRVLASQANWGKSKPWYALLDPQYYQDILNSATMTSSDYVGGEAPVVSGQVAKGRFGFNILEDDSRSTDFGLLFHPDFMHMVMQTAPTVKVSDLHANKQFGYIMSVNVIFGAKLGINGNLKHIKVYNT